MNKAIKKVFSFNSMHVFSSYKFLISCEYFSTIFGNVTIDVISMGNLLFHNFILVIQICNVEISLNDHCFLLYSFNFQMTPKS